MSNIVYIATSLDGYIADKSGGLEWLNAIPNPEHQDFGFSEFMDRIDALVMGRKTFETVAQFDGEWPYPKPVFVLSNTLASLPDGYDGKAVLMAGPIRDLVENLRQNGYEELYIDGGVTIQNFLQEGLIDEMIITRIPVVLGGGTPLFGTLAEPVMFEHIKTEVLLDAMVQSHYRKKPTTQK